MDCPWCFWRDSPVACRPNRAPAADGWPGGAAAVRDLSSLPATVPGGAGRSGRSGCDARHLQCLFLSRSKADGPVAVDPFRGLQHWIDIAHSVARADVLRLWLRLGCFSYQLRRAGGSLEEVEKPGS